MFFALMYPLLLLADIIVFVFVLLLERVFLRVQFVLYFIMGSRVRLCSALWRGCAHHPADMVLR